MLFSTFYLLLSTRTKKGTWPGARGPWRGALDLPPATCLLFQLFQLSYIQKLCTEVLRGVLRECRMLLNQVPEKTKFKGAYDTWNIVTESIIGVYCRIR